MLSSTDLEKLWFLYKMEGEPRNVSIERFSELNGVPADVFTKWLKKRERRIERVEVEGMPQVSEEGHKEDNQTKGPIEKIIKTVDDLKALQSDGYDAYYYLDNEQCGIEHLCCLAHVRAKFFLAWKQGLDQSAKDFLDLIWLLYKAEREYQKQGYTAEEIHKARNSKETQKIVDDLQDLLYDTMTDGRDKGKLMLDALNYMHDFWKQVMAYRNDGRYSIDNSIAERAIRPMTIERKNKVAFGSEAGAELSCLFHTINETIKLQGKSIKKYYREFLTAVNSGRTDYENLTPALIG